MTFAQARIPSSVYVPGEGNVNVLQYDHVAKQCKNPVCRRCGESHKLADYAEPLAKCLYCKGEHRVEATECLKQKRE